MPSSQCYTLKLRAFRPMCVVPQRQPKLGPDKNIGPLYMPEIIAILHPTLYKHIQQQIILLEQDQSTLSSAVWSVVNFCWGNIYLFIYLIDYLTYRTIIIIRGVPNNYILHLLGQELKVKKNQKYCTREEFQEFCLHFVFQIQN